MADTRTGPLAGIKVIDMGSVILGPMATMLLGDLGADVIKVESPRGGGGSSNPGDLTRLAGKTPVKGVGPLFAGLNRNKRSVALDLAVPEDKADFLKLIAEADVFIHNVRMAGMKRLGCDYDSLKAINPRLIYVHASGFGEDGPYARLTAYDDLIQAASGFCHLTQLRDGGGPTYTPSAVADKSVGLFAYSATLAALFHRERTGEGQFVQVPMFECFTFFNLVEHMYGQVWQEVDGEMGYTRQLNPQRQPFPTKDGHISIAPYNEAQWARFLTVAGFPEAYAEVKRRAETGEGQMSDLFGYIRQAAAAHTTDELMTMLAAEDIPAMRCNELAEVLTDEHLNAVDFFEVREHPAGGHYRSMKHPVKYTASPAEVYRHPPTYGEHSAEVLGR